mmetsp:Transcript_15562/g.43112  ORF Transcript_15562/g.43112 Transcript_15562/m.43112 type:complete len:341 (-) Transcript_15562:1020-2042(-)
MLVPFTEFIERYFIWVSMPVHFSKSRFYVFVTDVWIESSQQRFQLLFVESVRLVYINLVEDMSDLRHDSFLGSKIPFCEFFATYHAVFVRIEVQKDILQLIGRGIAFQQVKKLSQFHSVDVAVSILVNLFKNIIGITHDLRDHSCTCRICPRVTIFEELKNTSSKGSLPEKVWMTGSRSVAASIASLTPMARKAGMTLRTLDTALGRLPLHVRSSTSFFSVFAGFVTAVDVVVVATNTAAAVACGASIFFGLFVFVGIYEDFSSDRLVQVFVLPHEQTITEVHRKKHTRLPKVDFIFGVKASKNRKHYKSNGVIERVAKQRPPRQRQDVPSKKGAHPDDK